MNKKLLFSILFVMSIAVTSLAQVNKELSKTLPSVFNNENALKANQYSTKTLTLALGALNYQPLFNAPLLNTNIGPAQNVWVSEVQHSEIHLNNIMIRTEHYYDINSTLLGSSMNIMLSRHFSYRIFP